MLDLPSDQELTRDVSQHREKRLRSIGQVDCIIEGAGLSGFVAGIVLQNNDLDILILDSSDHIGGRMTWETDPLPIYSPADEILEDLSFEIRENPPIWIERTRLLCFLGNQFFSKGGNILLRTEIRSVEPSGERSNKIHIRHENHSELVKAEQVIRTTSDEAVSQSQGKYSSNLSDMVKATARQNDGTIDAGYRVLHSDVSDQTRPYENACLLSGRKAAEIALSGFPSTPLKK